MVQNEKLTSRHCEFCKSAPGIVTEFDFVRAIQYFYNRPHLTTYKTMVRQFGE